MSTVGQFSSVQSEERARNNINDFGARGEKYRVVVVVVVVVMVRTVFSQILF
jgi:hypothetical protein